MNTSPTTKNEKTIARPLKILIPIIQSDLNEMEELTLDLKIKIGGELLEAKEHLQHGEWGKWLKRNFGLSHSAAADYMGMSEENSRGREFSSVKDYRQKRAARNKKAKEKKQPQSDRNGLESADQLFKEEKRLRKLAIELVDAGYRTLSVKYHPDKGGDPETMKRLSEVRKTLKSTIERKEIAFR